MSTTITATSEFAEAVSTHTPVAKWSYISRSPALARSSHSIVLQDGTIYIYGGEQSPRTPVDSEAQLIGALHWLNSAEPNPAWNLSSAMRQRRLSSSSGVDDNRDVVPAPRVGAAVAMIGGEMYVWGGRGGKDMMPLDRHQTGLWKVKVGDVCLTWERVTAVNEEDAPVERSYHSMVSVENRIFVHAGCPSSGRLSTLHEFDTATRKWAKKADAPEPGRGGTSLCPAKIGRQDSLLRFGGFAGYELGADGAVDVYSIEEDVWSTVIPSPDPRHGSPGARSVYGFVPYSSSNHPGAVALLFYGEKSPSSAGHEGAGQFWDDIWLLYSYAADGPDAFVWKKVKVNSRAPEARGWFGYSALGSQEKNKGAVMHGGLTSSNERADDLWALIVE